MPWNLRMFECRRWSARAAVSPGMFGIKRAL
jgi:hypothetical protein